MGVFNEGLFFKLKDHAEKLVKFKMAVSQKAAENKGMIDADHLKCIAGGACAGYVLAWIRQQFGGPLAFHRSAGVSSAKDKLSRQTAADVAPLYAKYSRAQDQRTGLKKLAEDYGLSLGPEKKRLLVRPLLTLFTDIQYKIKPGQAYFISAEVLDDGTTQAHALGMFQSETGLHFFDPNIGEYRIKQAEKFFSTYVSLVQQNLKWTYGEASADRVVGQESGAVDIDDLMALL